MSAIAFPRGVAVVILRGDALVAIPIVGSVIVVIALAVFALILFRTSPTLTLCGHFSCPSMA